MNNQIKQEYIYIALGKKYIKWFVPLRIYYQRQAFLYHKAVEHNPNKTRKTINSKTQHPIIKKIIYSDSYAGEGDTLLIKLGIIIKARGLSSSQEPSEEFTGLEPSLARVKSKLTICSSY